MLAELMPSYNHAYVPDQYIKRLRALARLPLVGLWVPAPSVIYRVVRQEARQHLIFGLPEDAEGSDPLDRLLKGLEGTGAKVVTGTSPVGIESRFVATMVLALRCALGRMVQSPATWLTAEREYLRVCRARDVRLCVVESNRRMVLDVYFKEECMDEIVDRFARLPRWLEWLVWFYGPIEYSSSH